MKNTIGKRWFVEIIKAESWEHKDGAPNLSVDNQKFLSLDEAQRFVQRRMGDIFNSPFNAIEWVSWKTDSVEVRYRHAHKNSEDNTLQIQTSIFFGILEVEGGVVRIAEIGV